MSMLIAWPWKKGISGASSSVGLHVCPKAMTRSRSSSCRFGHLEARASSRWRRRSPGRRSRAAPACRRGGRSAVAQQVLAVLLEQLEDRRCCATTAILISSAMPLRTWSTGSVVEEREVEDHLLRGVERAEPVLRLAVVDRDLDRDAGVDRARSAWSGPGCSRWSGGTIAHANPATSVVRPPPTTSTGSVRTRPKSPNASTMRSSVRSVLSVSSIATAKTVRSMPWWSK